MTMTTSTEEKTASGGDRADGIGGALYNTPESITINGGNIHATGGTNNGIGINASTITLNWTNLTDSYYSGSYKGSVTLAKEFNNEYTILNAGQVADNGVLGNKTLVPPLSRNTFITAGDWNDATHWNTGTVPGSSDKAYVFAAATITDLVEANNIKVGTNGSITIAEGGQLIHSNTGVRATVQKSIAGHEPSNLSGWSFIASPIIASVNPSTIGLITDNYGNNITGSQTATYDLYYYDEPDELWKNYRQATFNMNNGQGYLYANNEGTTISFEGTLNASTADPTIAVTASAGNLTGFNLVGNPFARNLSISKLALQVGEEYSPITAIYEINNGEVIINEDPSDIPPCEGFFIQTNTAGTLHFNHSRTEGNNSKGDLRIEVSHAVATREGTTLLDRAYINFEEGNAIDKFMLNPDATKLYIPQGGKDYAIASVGGDGVHTVSTEMPVNFKASENGTYTITVNTNHVEMSYLHLIDNLTGNDVDLLALRQAQGPATYTFTAKTTDYESRFRMVFSTVCEDADGDSETFAYINNGNIIVNGEGTLQIIDVMGRVIASCTDVARNVSTSGMTPGVYVLRLINGNDVKTQKIVVK